VVVLRGWLDETTAGGPYRLFTSNALTQWLDIPKGKLLYQLKPTNSDYSLVWVNRETRLVKCHKAKACHFQDEVELDIDPTNPRGEGPRYGNG
jgi:hypothetical protein